MQPEPLDDAAPHTVDAPGHPIEQTRSPGTEGARRPDFAQPDWSRRGLTGSTPDLSTPGDAVRAAGPREPAVPLAARVIGGLAVGLVAAQGLSRFAQLAGQASGALPGPPVPMGVGLLGLLLFLGPVTVCLVLSTRRSRYALLIGLGLAVVIAVLGRLGGVDLLAVLG